MFVLDLLGSYILIWVFKLDKLSGIQSLLFTVTSDDLSHVGFSLFSFFPEAQFQLLVRQNFFLCHLVPACTAV